MEAMPDGDFLVCGYTNPSAGLKELYISRLRPASTDWQTTYSVVWEKTFTEAGDPSDFTGSAVRMVEANQIAGVGSKTETGNDDLLLLLLDASGNETSRRIFGDEGFQVGEGLDLTPSDNGLIIVGTNGSEDNSMVSLLKTDASGKL
jgi:hypothetical protein